MCGTKCNEGKLLGFRESHNWVNKSIFGSFFIDTQFYFDNLNVMHIKWDVLKSVFNMMMDINGKTKDHIHVCTDLAVYCGCKELELVETNGCVYIPQASYTLRKDDRRHVCAWVK